MMFTGKVHKISLQKNAKNKKQTVCISNICNRSGEFITNHIWFLANDFHIDLNEGDVIEFTAKVSTYIKGRWKKRSPDNFSKKLQVDYALKYPREVRIIKNHKENGNG